MMRDVALGLMPGVIVLTLSYGVVVPFQLMIGVASALAAEACALKVRGRSLSRLLDGSALVTGLLLALSLPPSAPWWAGLTGAALALLFGKHVYGGLGQNPFNPAMLGYALLLLAFPREMTLWPAAPGLFPDEGASFSGSLAAFFQGSEAAMDAMARATPLTQLHEQWRGHVPAMPEPPGNALRWAVLNLAYLMGGLYLWRRGIIDYRIPSGILVGSLGALALDFWIQPSPPAPAWPLLDLFLGASMMGAFFIATDPVSAAGTPMGRWIYGAGIGFLMILIRHHGAYPDGLAFAVLIMNFVAPTLDRYTRPSIFGNSSEISKAPRA